MKFCPFTKEHCSTDCNLFNEAGRNCNINILTSQMIIMNKLHDSNFKSTMATMDNTNTKLELIYSKITEAINEYNLKDIMNELREIWSRLRN